MTATPAHVSEEVFAVLRRHLTAEAIVELAAAVATENFSARFNHAFEIESEGLTEAWQARRQ